MRRIILNSIPIILLLSFWTGAVMQAAMVKAEILKEISLNLALVESRVSESVKGDLDKMRGLSTHIGLNPEFNIKDIDYFITEVMDGKESIISNIGVFEDTKAVYLYPYDENKAMADIDLMDLPAFKADAQRVKNDFETIITPPEEMVQGGLGIIIRLPITLVNGDYWGQIGYMMKYEDVLEAIGLTETEYNFKVEQINEKDGHMHIVFDGGFNSNAITNSLDMKLPLSKWIISVSNDSIVETLSLPFWIFIFTGLFSFFISRLVIRNMRFSEFMMRNLVDSTDDIVLIIDKSEKLQECSLQFSHALNVEKQKILGLDIDEAINAGRVSKHTRDSIRDMYNVASIIENVVNVQIDGEDKYFNLKKYSMNNGQGTIIVGHDINEIKKQEMATEEAWRLAEETAEIQSRFLANMSHEIRTPMNGILGMLELSLLEPIDSLIKDYLNVAKSSAKSLLTILNDILDFSRLEVNKVKISPNTFHIHRLLDDLKMLFEYTCKEKNIEFEIIMDDRLPTLVIGDEVRIRQILTNLISNAVKFTSEGSVNLVINVLNITEDCVSIRFSVIDTGIGIAEKRMEQLFERFDQLDGSITRNYGGSGLGLAITKGLLELMGSSIVCTSELGVGSDFSFVIELASSNEEINTYDDKHSLNISDEIIAKSVLVVDDDVTNRKVMEAIIERLGHEVRSVKNGREAVALCKIKRFDIVFMDISMPIMDGLQAIYFMKKEPDIVMDDMTVIALTAFAQDDDKVKCLESGFSDYMSKPAEISEIAKRINDCTKSPQLS